MINVVPTSSAVPGTGLPRGGLRTIPWQLWRTGLEFLFPPHCPCCSAAVPTSADNGHDPFCDKCQQELHPPGADRQCGHCAAPIGPYVDPRQPCRFCVREGYAFQSVICLGVYQSALRRACLGGKVAGGERVLHALAETTWTHMEGRFRHAAADLIVPVPQFWLQRWIRPHNPPETLAHCWARRLQVKYHPHILIKQRWTAPQRHLSPAQRRQNVANAFRVARAQRVAGASILLVDDVLTTGATAHAAARVLKQAGAARVMVAVLARGIGAQ